MISKRLTLMFLSVQGIALLAKPVTHYMAAIRVEANERTPALAERTRGIAERALTETLEAYKLSSFDVHRRGNELVFTLFSHSDMREQLDQVIPTALAEVHGKGSLRGDYHVYETRDPQPIYGKVKVVLARPEEADGEDQNLTEDLIVEDSVLNPQKVLIQSISAQSVTLRQLFETLQEKIASSQHKKVVPEDKVTEIVGENRRPSFGYFVSEECMNRRFSWKFGEKGSPAKDLDTVIREIALMLEMKLKKPYDHPYYIFSGTCPSADSAPTTPVEMESAEDLFAGMSLAPSLRRRAAAGFQKAAFGKRNVNVRLMPLTR